MNLTSLTFSGTQKITTYQPNKPEGKQFSYNNSTTSRKLDSAILTGIEHSHPQKLLKGNDTIGVKLNIDSGENQDTLSFNIIEEDKLPDEGYKRTTTSIPVKLLETKEQTELAIRNTAKAILTQIYPDGIPGALREVPGLIELMKK